jgi:hypothetical protein
LGYNKCKPVNNKTDIFHFDTVLCFLFICENELIFCLHLEPPPLLSFLPLLAMDEDLLDLEGV